MRYVAHYGLQGFRAKGVHSFDIISKEKRDDLLNDLKDIADVQQKEQASQHAILDYTACHHSRFRYETIRSNYLVS